jgi:4-amino-4-deoxy-L-arabinose transferase-like glycosyltransferase
MTSIPRAFFLMLALVLALLALSELGTRRLADPDEGRYSEISREMAQSNDFVTPRLNGLKYFEKPPLQYWATAIAFKLLGESEFSARLYTFLCALGCILLIGYTGSRLYGAETGIYAVLALLGSWYFTAFTQIVTLDMGLTLWMTVGVCGFLLAQSADNASSRRCWMLMAWAGMAFAVLSKGLIGIVFPSAAIFFYWVIQRDWRLLAKLEWFYGLLLFLVITVPWFAMVSLQNPEFPRFFFIHEHFERFLSNTHRREGPWWTFIAITVLGFMPWGLAICPAIINSWRNIGLRIGKPDGSTFLPLRFVLIFSAFILFFFSISSSKLPGYILPIFPVLAFVIGAYLKEADTRLLGWLSLPTLALALAGAFAAWKTYSAMGNLIIAGLLVWASAVLIAFWMFRQHKRWLGILTMSIATCILTGFAARGFDDIAPKKLSYAVAAAIKQHLTPETRLYAIKIYDQSLPFYLKRTLTLVDYVDEFQMGQNAEPAKHIAALKDLPAAWSMAGPAIAIIQPDALNDLKSLGINFEIIYQDARRIAIRKPEPK